MLSIESHKNETFKSLLSLTGSKGLKKEGLFLLSGEKLIREFLQKPILDIVQEITSPSMPSILEKSPFKDKETIRLSSDLFNQLDVLGTHFNILALRQPTPCYLDESEITSYQPNGLEVVIPIGDPGNLGALLRSCEAFGVPKVLLTQESAHPFLPKSVKASAGSVLRLPITYAPSLSLFPRNCIALDMDGISLDDFVWPDSGLLVVGEEGPGFGKDSITTPFTQRISIPTLGVESLNVVVAASIALSHRRFLRSR